MRNNRHVPAYDEHPIFKPFNPYYIDYSSIFAICQENLRLLSIRASASAIIKKALNQNSTASAKNPFLLKYVCYAAESKMFRMSE